MTKDAPRYAPDPSVHATPEIAAVCPYCHPERVEALRAEAFRAELAAGRGIVEAADLAQARYCTTGELPRPSYRTIVYHTTGEAPSRPPRPRKSLDPGRGVW